VAGASQSVAEEEAQEGDERLLDRCLTAALAHLPVSKAASIAAAVSGVPRAKAYARALELKDLSAASAHP
jgi:hypothetical protein